LFIYFYYKFNTFYIMDKNKEKEDENLATKRNEDWWRLEKSQFGRKKLP